MKNVLQIMDYAAPYRGNFISAIECLEDYHKADGNTVYLFPEKGAGLPWIKEMATSGRKVYFMPASFFSRKVKVSDLKKLLSIVKKENIAFIHTHFIEYNYTLLVFRKLLARDITFVANFHNHYYPSGRLYLLKNFAIRHTIDIFIGDSPSVSASLSAIGIAGEKIRTIINSINFSRLSFNSKVQITSEGSKQAILMFGYPWYRKGVDVVVRAIAELNKGREFPLTLALAQAGCEDDTSEAIINTVGSLPAWVRFLGPREDLAAYYNGSSVFISAGREEGLSYSPIEAAYCNCMVICSNIPGNPLDIPGIAVYNVEDASRLEKELEMLLSLPEEDANARKSKQRSYVVENYNIKNWVIKVAECYTS